MMVAYLDSEDASKEAYRYLSRLKGSRPFNFSVEEVELTSDEKYWIIVCSYYDSAFDSRKSYRELKINSKTGNVISMKVKKI